jgi:hypothetical protein
MSSFGLQKPGWLLICFTTVAALPFVVILWYGYRLIKVAFNKADANPLENEETSFHRCLYFIYDMAREARECVVGCAGPAVGNNGI